VRQLGISLPLFSEGEFLSLSGHNFTDQGAKTVLEQLKKMNQIKDLTLYGCARLSGVCFDAICSRMPTLACLNLGYTGLTDAGLHVLAEQVSNFPGLRKLILSGCHELSGVGVAALGARLPSSLEELYFGDSSLNDTGLEGLALRLPQLCQLRRLDFRRCHNIDVSGLASLKSSLQGLLALMDSRTSGQCPVGADLAPPARPTFGMWFCSRCGGPAKIGDLLHVCPCCNYMSCDDCRRGSLWVPGHLKDTFDGEVFAREWSMAGREQEQLNWC